MAGRRRRSPIRAYQGLIAAVAVFLVAGFVFFVTGGTSTPTPKATPSPSATPIFALRASQVASFSLHVKGRRLVDKHGTNGWTFALCPEDQASCPDYPADGARVTTLLDVLLKLGADVTIPGAPAGLAAYAVDKPTTGEIIINSTSGSQIDFYIGGKDPGGSLYYLRKTTGNDVYGVKADTLDSNLFPYVFNPPIPVPSPSPSPAASTSSRPSP